MKLPLWFRTSAAYPLTSFLLFVVGRLLFEAGGTLAGPGYLLEIFAAEMNLPIAALTWRFWDYSHAYWALWPLMFAFILLNWIVVVVPLSWLGGRLLSTGNFLR